MLATTTDVCNFKIYTKQLPRPCLPHDYIFELFSRLLMEIMECTPCLVVEKTDIFPGYIPCKNPVPPQANRILLAICVWGSVQSSVFQDLY